MTLVSVLQSPFAAGTLAFVGIVMLALAVAILRRGGAEPVAPERDFASVSLEAPPGRQLVPQPAPVAITRPLPDADRPSPTPAAWGDDMPTTREDALAVLGIGVAPAATTAAIKKIVDGLRQSWHPDFARDAGDRELRELRLKQINAAWEILADRPAPA